MRLEADGLAGLRGEEVDLPLQQHVDRAEIVVGGFVGLGQADVGQQLQAPRRAAAGLLRPAPALRQVDKQQVALGGIKNLIQVHYALVVFVLLVLHQS